MALVDDTSNCKKRDYKIMKEKMIGLCLKYEQTNYGSKLQALATTKLFDKLGMQYKIIRYSKAGLWFKITSLPRIFNATFRQDKIESLSRQIAFKKHPELKPLLDVRMQMFRQFDKDYFEDKVEYCQYFGDLEQAAINFSTIISCSDQLWSPAGLRTNFYNLMFVPDNVNKVSFASSFGVSDIPFYQIRATRNYLRRINWISCRESRGAEIVKELTGRDVPVLMDPVFSFDAESWMEMVPSETIIEGEYLFCYFLGSNAEHRRMAQKTAEELNLKIVYLKYLDQYVPEDETFGDITPYNVGPSQFLNILRGAKYIITDSFHGCAFSIINQKQFVVVNRYLNVTSSKNSRIDSLCEHFELHDRRVNLNSNVSEALTNPIDWESVKIAETKYRSQIWDYIKESVL